MKHVDCFCEIESLQTGLYFQSKPVTCNGTVDLQESLSHQLYVGPGDMAYQLRKLDWKKGFSRVQKKPLFQTLRRKSGNV